MMTDGEQLKTFYRFVANNPHIALHDACQIIIERPSASVCFFFEEWNAQGRRVTKGRKGIPYYDGDGNKYFVFDVTDTHGENRYRRITQPVKKILDGLDLLNGTEIADSNRGDYRIMLSGVVTYLGQNDFLTENDEVRNRLIAEGVAYSLYSTTGFPKERGITLKGYPYGLQDNADLFREVQKATEALQQNINDAIYNKQNEVPVIDDIDEEYVSDEPVIPKADEQPVAQEEKTTVLPYYAEYLRVQKANPDSIVVYRLGDFYEVMGEKAEQAATILDLTLTGRNVGLPERVPMCGFPYHITDKYLGKLTESVSVVVVEPNAEPFKILSRAEARKTPELEALSPEESEELDRIFSEQEEAEEQPDYMGGIDTRFPIDDDYGDEDEPTDEEIEEAFEAAKEEESDEETEDYDYEEDKKQTKETKPENRGKPIWERRNRPSMQRSLFDAFDEQTPEEKLKEWGLKRGSGFEYGKYRIYEKYQENPTDKEFAEFLRREYGTGGGGYDYEIWTDGKGMKLRHRDRENPENEVGMILKWEQVAYGIADLIDEDKYFDDKESEEYIAFLSERRGTDENRVKAIARHIAEDGVKRNENGERTTFLSWRYADYKFCKDHAAEIEKALNACPEVATAKIDGDKVELTVKEAYRRYSEQPSEKPIRDLDAEEDEEWENRIESGEITPIESIDEPTKESNTDLTKIGFEQSELGGAKQRFKNNIEAIKLVNRLINTQKEATADEKKVLAKYVGWGGLAQAFDEHNTAWQNEYKELKDVLSVEEYAAAKGSVLNAHYTSKTVIDGIYKALTRFGVKGNNRILEPAMGTGNFFGFMPQEIADGAKLYGVELDRITGKIATKLYPQAKIQIKGFEETAFQDNSFDLMVTNVPFGGYTVFDPDYNKYNFYIHDYFIAKGIDKIKPNGLMAVITSKGTMDKQNPSIRKYIADRAELVGAVRLPNTAFKQTANTEVVTDILFFRKREDKINATIENTEWLATGKTEEGYEINNYYIAHSEMVLGTLAKETGLYGAEDITVKSDGRDLSEAINGAISRLPQDFYVNPEPTEEVESREEVEVDYDVKPMNLKAVNGKLYMRVGDSMVEQPVPSFPKDSYQRIVEMIAIRKQIRKVLDLQVEGCSDDVLTREQWQLGARYDMFVKRFGYINSKNNLRLFKPDGDSALLFACENVSDDEETVTKADVFTKRTIRPYTAVTSTDDCFEALQISKNERGSVDISYIEELTKKDYDTVLNELGNAVFRNPAAVNPEDKYSGFETAEEYLSGRVVDKLQTAERMKQSNPDLIDYDKNISALREVQPTPVKASDIAVRVGTSWIDKELYKEFFCELIGMPYYYRDGVELYYNKHDGSWRIDRTRYARNYGGMNVTSVYGTSRANAYRLFEDCLNQRSTQIYDTVLDADGREKRVLNNSETVAAREKQNKIVEAFKDWIFRDPIRRDELETIYNRLFNQIRLPKYDGSYLRFPEMNPAIELRPHQKDAVHRIITSGNTLLHHIVGSGKTFTICAAAMKLRQYGLAKKPMIAVPNHLVQQWANSFRELYPTAKLLIATKDDLDKDHREQFVSKVAMGDWDSVIIAQSSFAKINISPERQIAKIQEEISAIERSIEMQWEDSNSPSGSVKNLERIKKGREAQLKKLLDESKKDNVLIFEKLGVDYLFVDEADAYKNLFLYTKMNNVAGISNAASARASDLQLKIEYINELHGGDKGVVFATGTPISNSMTEMYTMQTYLQKRTLEKLGIDYFDAWAADFGETVTALELAPSGKGYRARTRFAKFTNLPELLTLYHSFADVKTDVKLDVPEVERKVITLKPSDTVIDLTEEIAKRADAIYAGGVDPHIDNMLKVTGDGKKLALDPRCIDPLLSDESGSKLNYCADNVYEEWKNSTDIKGTQLVFCDLSTPKKPYSEYVYGTDFDAYNDLKHKLVERGIPENEIAAPVLYMSQESLEDKNITFLKLGRDVDEAELKVNDEIAKFAMKAAYNKKLPLEATMISRNCGLDIEKGISTHFDGMHLNTDFIANLYALYGEERMNYVLANTVQMSDGDGRYSPGNKAWAKEININNAEDDRRTFYVNSHPALLDGFITAYRKHVKEFKEQLDKEENKEQMSENTRDYTKITARGDKVVNIEKDTGGRDIAIIDRTATSNKDYVVAIGYHTATGDWEQGRYGFESQEKAENWRKNEYGSEKPKIEYIKINVANDAFIKKSGVGSVFKMPTNGEYAGFTYYMFNDKIRPSRQLVDLQSDSRELCYELSVREDREIELRKGYGDNEQIVVLTAEEFKEAVGGTTNKDYETQENTDTKWLNTSVPQEAFRKEYPKSMLFVLPNKQDFGGMSFFIPSAFVGEDKNSDDGRILIRLPEDFVIKAQSRDETREATLTAYDFNQLCNNTTAEDYKQAQAESAPGSETPSDWNYVSVPEKARIASFDDSTLFRMPDGKYQDYTYYVPNKCVKENAEKGTIRLSLHNDYTVRLSDNSGEEKKTAELTAKDFCEEVREKDAGAYGADYKRPSVEANTSFDEKEKALRTAVPDEMKTRPNWVVVKTWWNADKGKYNKRPVNCNSDKGEYAESDNPETWTTFDNALKYLKEKGGTTVAYALDGKDNVSCIDLDHCYDENGQPSALAKDVLSKCGKTYVEKSVSGNGLHIFGKTEGMDIRSFSKDGDLEFYQKEHFIAMTGDGAGYSRLESFDTPEMKELLSRKCEKREEWKGVCKGVNGLSTMTDRDVVEKASNAKNGDKFKRLYAGEDLQNNHSNSDMSLMNLLAYWCNGDKEQMLRIFATSGLFRPNKSPDYYEGTAIKALRSMPVKSTYTPTVPKNTGGNGKR